MDGWMDGRTNESPPVFYRTSSPLGPLLKKGNSETLAGNLDGGR